MLQQFKKVVRENHESTYSATSLTNISKKLLEWIMR